MLHVPSASFFLPGELPEGVLQELKAYSTSLIRGFLNAVTGSDMCSYFNTNFPVVAPLQSSLLNIMCSTTGHGWLLFNTHKQLSPQFHSLLPVTAIPSCVALPAGRAPAPGELWGEGCTRAWLSGRKGASRAQSKGMKHQVLGKQQSLQSAAGPIAVPACHLFPHSESKGSTSVTMHNMLMD